MKQQDLFQTSLQLLSQQEQSEAIPDYPYHQHDGIAVT